MCGPGYDRPEEPMRESVKAEIKLMAMAEAEAMIKKDIELSYMSLKEREDECYKWR